MGKYTKSTYLHVALKHIYYIYTALILYVLPGLPVLPWEPVPVIFPGLHLPPIVGEQWVSGNLPGYRCTRSLVYQVIGVPDHWCTRSLEYPIIGVPGHWSTRSLGYQVIGVPGYRCTRSLKHRPPILLSYPVIRGCI